MAADPATPATTGTAAPPAALRTAFRELHGRRLHGFSLLLTLGDRPLAARLTAQALAAGSGRIDELRHPERAAAWLRAQVVGAMPRRRHAPSPDHERAALDPLGADPAVVDGLADLGVRQRAALITSDIERLDRRDVETVVGRTGAGLERLLTRARGRYVMAYATMPLASDRDPEAGPLVRRIRAVAARTLA